VALRVLHEISILRDDSALTLVRQPDVSLRYIGSIHWDDTLQLPAAQDSRLACNKISRYLVTIMTEKEAPGNGGVPTKNMMLRLDPDLAERLAGIAEVEGRSVSDVAREAIAALVEARRKDKRFRKLLEDSLARHERLLDLLRDDES
jgi:hypothetical protein